MRLVALAGGIGGAKLAVGLAEVLPAGDLTIIGNTGDDIELLGLRICPDLDTLAYTLSREVDQERGWGLRDDTFHGLRQLKEYGVPSWFQLGDRDLATHLYRTESLRRGLDLAEATRRICAKLGVGPALLPMANGYHPTFLETDRGRLHLQEYLIREGCRPVVRTIEYKNIKSAKPPAAVMDSLGKAEGVIICPSNPLISIGPILAVPEIRDCVTTLRCPRLAVSPIVAGKALKGPAGKMLGELGHETSALGVASLYIGFSDHFILDQRDAALRPEIEGLGMRVSVLDTVMQTREDKKRLARQVIDLMRAR